MREWWHKIRGFESFRVRRGIGQTLRQSYDEARAFKAVFGGEIIFDPYPRDLSVTSPL